MPPVATLQEVAIEVSPSAHLKYSFAKHV